MRIRASEGSGEKHETALALGWRVKLLSA